MMHVLSFVSFRFVSFRFVSFRFVSFRFVSFRLKVDNQLWWIGRLSRIKSIARRLYGSTILDHEKQLGFIGIPNQRRNVHVNNCAAGTDREGGSHRFR